VVDPPDQRSLESMSPARRRACLDLRRSPWRSPIAIRRSGEGKEVWKRGGDGGSGKNIPATQKSTKVSTNEDTKLGRFLQVISGSIVFSGS